MAEEKQKRDAVPEGSVTGEENLTAEVAAPSPEQEQPEETTVTELPSVSAEDTAAGDDITAEPSADEEPLEENAAPADETEATVTETSASHAAEITLETPRKRFADAIPANVRETVYDVLDTCESVVVAMFTVLLIFTYLFSVAVVEGDSMLPTLRDADRLLLINFADPEPGDVVVLSSESAYTFDAAGQLTEDNGLGKKIVKRLIAEENQTVDIDFAAGIVYVDGEPLAEPYTSTLTTRDEGAFTYPITVPEGYVFVLGDNRSVSKDSRHPDVGLIPEEDIVGKVWLRVYPFDDLMAVQ